MIKKSYIFCNIPKMSRSSLGEKKGDEVPCKATLHVVHGGAEHDLVRMRCSSFMAALSPGEEGGEGWCRVVGLLLYFCYFILKFGNHYG